MLGLFGVFGRDSRLKLLEAGLHARDLHPRLLPDGVKIAAVRLLDAVDRERRQEALADHAAELIAYAVLGPEVFPASNGQDRMAAADRRILDAIDVPDGIDAKLLSLLLLAGLAHSEFIERHELVVEQGPTASTNGV